MRALPSGVVLKSKRDSFDRPSRFKARLLARGNLQDDLDDYLELYAPVACIKLVRTIIAVAVGKGWSIDHLNVVGTFLHAIVPKDDRVWIRLSTVAGTSLQGQIVELVKSLYGLN